MCGCVCVYYIYIYIYIYIQWGKQVFSQPPIVQVLPLKNMREACNFHHRYTSTMRDKIRKKKSRKSHCRICKEFICKLWWKISAHCIYIYTNMYFIFTIVQCQSLVMLVRSKVAGFMPGQVKFCSEYIYIYLVTLDLTHMMWLWHCKTKMPIKHNNYNITEHFPYTVPLLLIP